MPDIKAVIFDIGGVVVGSPILGTHEYEKEHGLPFNYINAAITATGRDGAFQRLERGELKMDRFYDEFGRGLSDVRMANAAYERYCRKTNRECGKLPERLEIDGRELWTTMMTQALVIDRVVFDAIVKLRRSGKVKVAALTNNFEPVKTSSSAAKALQHKEELPSYEEMQQRIFDDASENAARTGSGQSLKDLFDHFIESAVEGVRKPDPRMYEIALKRIGVKPEEAAFLDDIGLNLVSARKLGIHTVRVHPGRSREAIEELEQMTGIPLLEEVRAKM